MGPPSSYTVAWCLMQGCNLNEKSAWNWCTCVAYYRLSEQSTAQRSVCSVFQGLPWCLSYLFHGENMRHVHCCRFSGNERVVPASRKRFTRRNSVHRTIWVTESLVGPHFFRDQRPWSFVSVLFPFCYFVFYSFQWFTLVLLKVKRKKNLNGSLEWLFGRSW